MEPVGLCDRVLCLVYSGERTSNTDVTFGKVDINASAIHVSAVWEGYRC